MLENNKNYKLVIAYDGTDFAGWQVQKNQKSIANVIENRFYNVFKKKIHLAAASRTDAGVHAYGQVASFKTDLAIDPQKMRWALPPAINLRSLEIICDTFNPRYDVVQKVYWYHFFLKQPSPWVQRFGYYHPTVFNYELLQDSLQYFVGTHDFRSFCSGSDLKNTMRTIDSIELVFNEQWDAYRIVFYGKSFLRYMIRRIVGACFEINQKKSDPIILKKILEEKNPCQLFSTAPAHGLMLYEVNYDSYRK
jgi:tRNA pseudouridine38-40 synthase